MTLRFSDWQVGIPSSQALRLIVAQNAAISAVFAFQYQHPKLLQQRLTLTTEEMEIFRNALVLRERSKLPFWESLMLTCFDQQRDCSRLLEAAGFHQSHRDSLIRIPRDDVMAGKLTELARSQRGKQHLSFSSRIETTELGIKHLPLLDFHCPETPVNDALIQKVWGHLNSSSALVFSSGESYHALGLALLSDEDFRTLLVRSLLFAPIVDARYVAHQLMEGESALRLSNSSDKPVLPSLKLVVPQSSSHSGSRS